MLFIVIAKRPDGSIHRVYGPTDRGQANTLRDRMEMLQTIDPPLKFVYEVVVLTPP